MNQHSLLIWGAGGHGLVVADTARALGYQIAGFVDRDAAKLAHIVDRSGSRVICTEKDLHEAIHKKKPLPGDASFVALGIGNNAVRLQCAKLLGDRCAPPLIHPTAIIANGVSLDLGVVVCLGAIVNVCASIGLASIINSGSIIEHDCILGQGVHISPGAVITGGVHVGHESWIGAGATIIPMISVGDHAIVGAGSVVLHNVISGVTVVGNPARPLTE